MYTQNPYLLLVHEAKQRRNMKEQAFNITFHSLIPLDGKLLKSVTLDWIIIYRILITLGYQNIIKAKVRDFKVSGQVADH